MINVTVLCDNKHFAYFKKMSIFVVRNLYLTEYDSEIIKTRHRLATGFFF